MANFKGKIKKLQTAIVKRGMVIKINQYQFYSTDQRRMITCYRIFTPVMQYIEKKEEWKETDYEILNTCSVIDLIECLVDIYKAMAGNSG